MAERRMFAKTIVLSDAFLDMPMSARCLYFTLGMFADDDGFVGGPKSVMRQCGASQDDLLILLQKRFVLAFESGVIVIKHWRMNNYLQNDRKKDTSYLKELAELTIDDKGAYTEKDKDDQMYTKCIHSVYTGKDSIDKDSIDKDNNIFISPTKVVDINNTPSCQSEERYQSSFQNVISAWNSLSELGIKPIRGIKEGSKRINFLRARIKQYGEDDVLTAISNIRESPFLQGNNKRGWTITFDWFLLPNNFPKVLEGNYTRKSANVRDEINKALEDW